MCSDAVVQVERAFKSYAMYERPSDRLVELLGRWWEQATGRPARSRHRRYHALSDVSLRIGRGETVGIIGRNGSGKSTLLQMLCGTLQATRGSIRVQGRVAALLELGSGFDPEFSGRENVFLNAAVLGLSREQTLARFDAITAFADIGDFIDRPLKTYSSGMAMRLAFAVIAHVDADILIIDEALSVGDAFFTQKCMRHLRAFMKSGTVIFVSHDIEAVMALCSRVVWLDGGKVREDGDTKVICQAYLDVLLGADKARHGASESDRPRSALASRDAREELWNASPLRNDIRVFSFDPDAEGIGQRGGSIADVRLVGSAGESLTWVVGGEAVRLEVQVHCHVPLHSPILGFMVKDRTGQALFGDNTWLSYMDAPLNAQPGQVLIASFSFDMPRLPCGDYTMVVALADGSQADNVMHHWLHDALHFQCVASNVANGLVGIPMRSITFQPVPR